MDEKLVLEFERNLNMIVKSLGEDEYFNGFKTCT
jgi:hypothetical protein